MLKKLSTNNKHYCNCGKCKLIKKKRDKMYKKSFLHKIIKWFKSL